LKIFRYRSSNTAEPRIAAAVDGGPPRDLLIGWDTETRRDQSPPPEWPTSTAALVAAGPETWSEAEALARVGDEVVNSVEWLCPLDRLSSLRDFLAFEDHVSRGADRRGVEVPAYWYAAPVYYKGNHRSIIGPEAECPWPSYTKHLDFELELGMILGVGGRDVAEDEAGAHVFVFTILNDFSARDIQAQEMTAWLGPAKGKDFATALGPCIATVDEVGAEPDLQMICRVNGEEWGRARSSEARWRWAEMIAHVSTAEDVYPGDVYGSGTPGGCCGLDLGRKLAPGDVVELEVESI
jgi:2-keto-4-pentenoate hydratase/2-oxohepta-3-ene-1,7-dioic acid hydratase in catechol pathway